MQQKPFPPKALDIVNPSQLIHAGGSIDRVTASLRLFGDSLVSEEITLLIGCTPTETRKKGEVVPDKRHHRTANTGMWRLNSNLEEGQEIEEHIIHLLSRVTSDLKIWERLSSGFSCDIFCGLFLENFNRTFDLTTKVMKMLSERGLTLRFDVYGE